MKKSLVLASLLTGCTTLGPMPATTGISAVPAHRPGAEVQAGTDSDGTFDVLDCSTEFGYVCECDAFADDPMDISKASSPARHRRRRHCRDKSCHA